MANDQMFLTSGGDSSGDDSPGLPIFVSNVNDKKNTTSGPGKLKTPQDLSNERAKHKSKTRTSPAMSSSIGTGVRYLTPDDPTQWTELLTAEAELTKKVMDQYARSAEGSRVFEVLSNPGALSGINPFDDGYFNDWPDKRKGYKDALAKLGGNTPISGWATEMALPIQKAYLTAKNFWDHATKPRKDDYWPDIEISDKDKYTPTKIQGAGMVWDAEQYWDFVKYLKQNYTKQFVTQMEAIKHIPDKQIRDEYSDHMEKLGEVYLGMIRESAIPFAASSQDELYKRADEMVQFKKDGKLSRETVSTKSQINDYSQKMDDVLGDAAKKPEYLLVDRGSEKYGGMSEAYKKLISTDGITGVSGRTSTRNRYAG